MGTFTVFPAIDLRRGRVVRLVQGRADRERVYSADPAEMAQRWASEGAAWLHVVNLDGAFGDADALNATALADILAAVELPVQFGGGLRDLSAMRHAFALGVSRIVLGTLAVEQPDSVSIAVREFGEARVMVAIETRGGNLATRGWQHESGIDAVEFGKRMRGLGVNTALVTDIARDGMLTGVDAEAMADFARTTGLHVIAAGGAATLDDIDRLAARRSQGVIGVNVGQALYTGAFTLKQALARAHTVTGLPAAEQGRRRKPLYCEG